MGSNRPWDFRPIMTEEEREDARVNVRGYLEYKWEDDRPKRLLAKFVLDLDERIERLRNPLTPESKGEKSNRVFETLADLRHFQKQLLDQGLMTPEEYDAAVKKVPDNLQGEAD